MTPKQAGLGKGLDALLKDSAKLAGTEAAAAERIPLDLIDPAPWQPRRAMDEGALRELADSIREQGILQPLIVRRKPGGRYELVAGERRFRAAGMAGIDQAPVIVIEADDRRALELALIENLQREDLNPLEEARGYRTLAEQFGLSHDEIARHVGKARATITNSLRLLELPAEVQQMLAQGKITAGHAKVLLGVETVPEQILLAKRVASEQLSVRQLERIVARRQRTRRGTGGADDIPEGHLQRIEEELRRTLGTPVKVHSSRTYSSGKSRSGRIVIEFYSPEELDRLLQFLGLRDL